MTKIYALTILMLVFQHSRAQETEYGIPKSFSADVISIHNAPVTDEGNLNTVLTPVVNKDSLLEADSIAEADTIIPARFGIAFHVNYNLKNSGTWDTLQDSSRLWRLKIVAPGALSENFIFKKFTLPVGSNLFIYNKSANTVLGGFTSNNNRSSNKFSTDIVEGDTIIIEYWEPKESVSDSSSLEVSTIVYGYRKTKPTIGDNMSQECNVDVNCEETILSCVNKRSVAMILLNDNTRWASGVLVNNTAEDYKGYFITAGHCIDVDKNQIISPGEQADAESWIFRFHYWSSGGCDSEIPNPFYKTISGCSVVSFNPYVDALLVQLPYVPTDVVFAGWNVDGNQWTPHYPLNPVYSLHHPKGDMMKISRGGISDRVNQVGDNFITPQHGALEMVFWKVYWNQFVGGITEPGSSGSPLFDSQGRLVGIDSKGPHSTCNPFNTADKYTLYSAFNGIFSGAAWGSAFGTLDPFGLWLKPIPSTSIDPYVCDYTAPPTLMSNRNITATNGQIYSGLTILELEGLRTGFPSAPFPPGEWFPPNNVPFEVEANADVEFKARDKVVLKRGVHIKPGSKCHIYTGPIECDDNILPSNLRSSNSDKKDYSTIKGKVLINTIKGTSTDTLQNNLPLISDVKIGVYPNPNNGQFYISMQGTSSVNIDILNHLGKAVYHEVSNKQTCYIDMSFLASGIYLIKATVNSTGKVLMQQVIIE